jgi:arsenate reductase-like glutaredoxin family protein
MMAVIPNNARTYRVLNITTTEDDTTATLIRDRADEPRSIVTLPLALLPDEAQPGDQVQLDVSKV